MDQKFHAAFFCSPVEKNGKNVYFKGLYYARCSMTFNKRILIKPAIILLAALLALGYSLWKERTDDPVPEIAEMKRLLRDAAPGDASLMKHYTSADSALFRRKLYAEARRLNGVMRKAEKKTSAIPAHFFDFSDYMSYIGERSFDRALEVLAAQSEDILPIFCLNDNAADGTDVSWIWDADYESLFTARHYASIGVYGVRAQDMRLRLKYAGADDRTITVYDTADDLAAAVQCAGKPVVVLPNYTSMLTVRDKLSALAGGGRFWE